MKPHDAISALFRTYDSSLDYNVTMYDHFPYVRNWDYCNESTVALISGNVIKCYRYIPEQPKEINNKDSLIDSILARMSNSFQQVSAVSSALLENENNKID